MRITVEEATQPDRTDRKPTRKTGEGRFETWRGALHVLWGRHQDRKILGGAKRNDLTKLLHHLGASEGKCVLVAQIKLREFIPKHTFKYVKMVVLITLKV